MNTFKNKQFLIVDDDTTFLSLLNRGLVRRGYTVTQAEDAQSALEAARKSQPDYAVIDLKLIDDSGLLLIKPLLAVKQDIKIVILTGYGSISTAVEAMKSGAVNFLAKPVDIDTLIEALMDTETTNTVEKEAEPMSLKRLEWENIQRVLNENDGNISATSRALGLHRRTLQRKLQKRPVKR